MNGKCPKCAEKGKEGFLSITPEGSVLIASCTSKNCDYRTAIPERRIKNIPVSFERRRK